ncbi:MAG: transposase [Verrucomicrobiota bacterium]|nr:transposase [Verrucomicrobiota bacterium]
MEFEGAMYHLLSRGDRRENIFWDDKDRESFLALLGRCCGRTGWQVHAYCLMSNHFHLVIETPRANLVAGMKWFLGAYTMRFNRRHRLNGHLFGGRYKSILIDDSTPEYLRAACDYVHLNPARARMVPAEEALKTYEWSSYPSYLQAERGRPGWLRCDRLLGEHGLSGGSRRVRREFAARTEAQRRLGDEVSNQPLRRGWFHGAEDYLERLVERLGQIPKPKRGRYRGSPATDLEVAERIVREGLREFGLQERGLAKLRKSDRRKVAIAHRVREQTAMELRWIGERLAMGGASNVSNVLRQLYSED